MSGDVKDAFLGIGELLLKLDSDTCTYHIVFMPTCIMAKIANQNSLTG